MTQLSRVLWKMLRVGGWAPLVVFAVHVFIGQVVSAYDRWPPIDIPMHFAGGVAMAFLVSGCFRALPRPIVPRNRLVVLELLLIASLTATAAVFWELAEFSLDQVAGSNVQVSLANTMKDLALGVSGAIALIVVRAIRLRAGVGELRELTLEWVRG